MKAQILVYIPNNPANKSMWEWRKMRDHGIEAAVYDTYILLQFEKGGIFEFCQTDQGGALQVMGERNMLIFKDWIHVQINRGPKE